jgi:hypothetical protein
MTSRLLPSVGLALTFALPAAPAAARDVCTTLGPAGYTIVFKGVKKLKPGRAVPLSGIGIVSATNVVPIHGSAIMDSAGNIELGFTGYGMLDGITNVMIQGDVDADFTGTAQLDADGDFSADAVAATLTTTDCKTVVIP